LNKGNWFKKPKIKNTNTNKETTVMGRNTSPLIPAFRSRILLRVCLMNNREGAMSTT
jgi:hypothetical protein